MLIVSIIVEVDVVIMNVDERALGEEWIQNKGSRTCRPERYRAISIHKDIVTTKKSNTLRHPLQITEQFPKEFFFKDYTARTSNNIARQYSNCVGSSGQVNDSTRRDDKILRNFNDEFLLLHRFIDDDKPPPFVKLLPVGDVCNVFKAERRLLIYYKVAKKLEMIKY
uniref:Uncharacterized protein n=1 Tax=Romanomermis culicivorax TaxID=13658 RepID=A0A915KA54_ROMCU